MPSERYCEVLQGRASDVKQLAQASWAGIIDHAHRSGFVKVTSQRATAAHGASPLLDEGLYPKKVIPYLSHPGRLDNAVRVLRGFGDRRPKRGAKQGRLAYADPAT